jgi:hypothetical protein
VQLNLERLKCPDRWRCRWFSPPSLSHQGPHEDSLSGSLIDAGPPVRGILASRVLEPKDARVPSAIIQIWRTGAANASASMAVADQTPMEAYPWLKPFVRFSILGW